MSPTATRPRRTPQVDFSTRVKIRLAELSLSVTALADELELDRNTVSRAIHHNLYQPTRRKIAERLSIPL